MGQKSILHAVKARTRLPSTNKLNASIIEEEEQEPAKPLSQTLIDLQLDSTERSNISEEGNAASFTHSDGDETYYLYSVCPQ